jgi:hypothetical protein
MRSAVGRRTQPISIFRDGGSELVQHLYIHLKAVIACNSLGFDGLSKQKQYNVGKNSNHRSERYHKQIFDAGILG